MIFKLHSSIGSMYAYVTTHLYLMYVFNYEPYIFTLIFIRSFYVFTYVRTENLINCKKNIRPCMYVYSFKRGFDERCCA